jgi:transcriptional regulator with XRE-family HTH domain
MSIQSLLKKLNEKMSDADIAEAVGLSQPTITRLRNGTHKTTSFEYGQAINKLAEKMLSAHDQTTAE